MKHIRHIYEAINNRLIGNISDDIEDILIELFHDYYLSSTVKTTFAPSLSGGYYTININIVDSRVNRIFNTENIYPTIDRIKDYLIQRGAIINDFYYNDRFKTLRRLESVVNVKIKIKI